MGVRHISFGGYEHHQREIRATHVHQVGEGHMLYGDGKTICRVAKNKRMSIVGIIGEDGLNEWGTPFSYDDYFLPHELQAGLPRAKQNNKDDYRRER